MADFDPTPTGIPRIPAELPKLLPDGMQSHYEASMGEALARAPGIDSELASQIGAQTAAFAAEQIPTTVAGVLQAAELNRAQEALGRAQIDGLTGAMSHDAFKREAERVIARTQYETNELGSGPFERPVLVITDLNDLKMVNDNREGGGHVAGDMYIAGANEGMRRAIRPTDLLGRIGGDEGAIMLPNVKPRIDGDDRLDYATPVSHTLNGVAASVNSIFDEMPRGESFAETRKPSLPFGHNAGIAMGWAVYEPGDTYDTMKQRADEMMYQNKPDRGTQE